MNLWLVAIVVVIVSYFILRKRTPPPVPSRPAPPATRAFGVNITFGMYQPKDLPLVLATGATYVRVPIAWDRIEQNPGVFDWSWYDAIIHPIIDAGLTPILICASTNPLFGVNAPATSEELARNAAFHAMVAARYPQAWFELGNEPNVPYFWPPVPNAPDYVRYATALATAIRSAPGFVGKLITAGLSGMFNTTFYTAVCAIPADYIGFHPYGESASTLPGKLALLRGLTSTPLFCTEYGSQGAQTDLASMAQACGDAGVPFVVYTLSDGTPEPGGGTSEFGLYTVGRVPKPSFFAMKSYARK